jgi:hypothetical protein
LERSPERSESFLPFPHWKKPGGTAAARGLLPIGRPAWFADGPAEPALPAAERSIRNIEPAAGRRDRVAPIPIAPKADFPLGREGSRLVCA